MRTPPKYVFITNIHSLPRSSQQVIHYKGKSYIYMSNTHLSFMSMHHP